MSPEQLLPPAQKKDLQELNMFLEAVNTRNGSRPEGPVARQVRERKIRKFKRGLTK